MNPRSTALSRKAQVEHALRDAGLRLFIRHGLRKTTMEAIAEEAQVAKATAYAYFPNKNAVFTAVVQGVVDGMNRDAQAAAEPAAPPALRIERSVLAKFVKLYELLHASTEAMSLLAASNRVSGAVVAKAHQTYVTHLTTLVVALGLERRAAREMAEVLDASAEGIVARARSQADAANKLTLLVRRMTGAKR